MPIVPPAGTVTGLVAAPSAVVLPATSVPPLMFTAPVNVLVPVESVSVFVLAAASVIVDPAAPMTAPANVVDVPAVPLTVSVPPPRLSVVPLDPVKVVTVVPVAGR